MLKTVRVHEPDEPTYIEFEAVRRVERLPDGQVRLEQCRDATDAEGPVNVVLLRNDVVVDVDGREYAALIP